MRESQADTLIGEFLADHPEHIQGVQADELFIVCVRRQSWAARNRSKLEWSAFFGLLSAICGGLLLWKWVAG